MAHETPALPTRLWARLDRRGFYSLRIALVVWVLLPLLLAMAVITAVGLRTLESAIETGLQEDVELVARAIRLPIGDSLEKRDDGNVRQALESVFRIGRVYGAYVYNREGNLVAAVGAVNPAPRGSEMADQAAGGERSGGYEEIQGREVYSYFEPLTDSSGRINGLLQVTRRVSDFQDDIGRVRLQAVGFIGAAGLAISVLLLVGHRGAVGQHLAALTRGMSRVESGDRAYRASLEGPTEIRALSAAFNTMLDGMDAAEREIAERRSEQTRLEDELRHAEKLAAIGRLAAGVAHELGTPLSVVDGKAQRALRRVGEASREHRSLEEIRAEVSRMEHIVRQLLEFARYTNRQFRWTRLDDLVHGALTALEELLTGRGVSARLESNDPGPDVLVDPVRIEQVLVNLLRNAVQAGASSIRIDWSIDDGLVCMSVDDDGPGVPEDVRAQLFEPFFTTRSVGEGTGLGLAVVHGIVTEHGGTIGVADSPMGGARFRVCLPLAPTPAGDQAARSPHDRNGGE